MILPLRGPAGGGGAKSGRVFRKKGRGFTLGTLPAHFYTPRHDRLAEFISWL
jgi:hypothetical protein